MNGHVSHHMNAYVNSIKSKCIYSGLTKHAFKPRSFLEPYLLLNLHLFAFKVFNMWIILALRCYHYIQFHSLGKCPSRKRAAFAPLCVVMKKTTDFIDCSKIVAFD